MKGTDFLTLRYAVGHAMPALRWRHHGIGCLQGYLHEGDLEVRIHVWHPTLIKPGFDMRNGAAHDHRFGFSSTVLLGSLFNERIELLPNDAGDWTTYTVEHARKAKQRTGSFDGNCVCTGDRYDTLRRGEWLREGQTYEMQAGDFHFSKASALACTIVTKTHLTDYSARILCRHDRDLMHAFDAADDYPAHQHLMLEAATLLRGELP